MASAHENQSLYIWVVMAEEKELVVESELNPLDHLHSLITGVASSAVFDSNPFFCFQFM